MVPIAAYLVLFQLVILRVPVTGMALISLGLIAVMVGLLFFIEGKSMFVLYY